MTAFHRLSTSQRLMAAIAVLVALLVATAAVALLGNRDSARMVERLAGEDLERIALVAEISDNANDAARKLIVLANAPRDLRISAYTEIDVANRRLDFAMTTLARRIEGGADNPAYRNLVACVRNFRVAYQDTADLIELEDIPQAQKKIVRTTDFELSALVGAAQALDRGERLRTTSRVEALGDELRHSQRLLLVLCGVGLLLAGGLSVWVARSVAEPLRATAQVARRFARGDYAARLPDAHAGEMADIAAAFELMASEVAQREAALRRMIDIDPLTGLPQRIRFLEEHGPRLDPSRPDAPRIMLLCFDVERLKSINSLLGFDAGDAVIVSAAARVKERVSANGAAARLGGGTFVALLPLQAADDALDCAAAFRRDVEHQLPWQDHMLDIAVATGMAVGPEHADTLAELLRRAEQALFEAKRQRGTLGQYSPTLEAARLSHLSMLTDLQRAVDQGELVPFLQPKMHLASGCIVGAEALVRWRHPRRGWVPPAEFIPFAEQAGRVASITQTMLLQCARLLAVRLPVLTIAVNISTNDLREPQFAARLAALLAEQGVAPGRLQVEVTETGLMDGGQQPIECLRALRALGVSIAIDDFGTGQSSLAYLQRLPAHELKIDRSFVHGIALVPARRELLASIVRLGHSLGLEVTAEGVETAEELALLREAGCDLAQGFHIARPLPVDEFVARYGPSAGQRSPALAAAI